MDGDIDDDPSSLSSVSPHYDQDYDDGASCSTSIYSHHGSRYPHQVRFMMRNEHGVTFMALLCRIPNTQYIPCFRECLQQDGE